MVSDRIRALRKRVESAKESAAEKRQRQRDRLRSVTDPVQSRVQSARDEAAAIKEETSMLADELGVRDVRLPEMSGMDDSMTSPEQESFDPTPDSLGIGLEEAEMDNDRPTADDTLGDT